MTAEAAQINKADLVRVLPRVAITERDLAQAAASACPASDPSGALICAEPGHGTRKLSAAGARDLDAATRSRCGRQAARRMRPL